MNDADVIQQSRKYVEEFPAFEGQGDHHLHRQFCQEDSEWSL